MELKDLQEHKTKLLNQLNTTLADMYRLNEQTKRLSGAIEAADVLIQQAIPKED